MKKKTTTNESLRLRELIREIGIPLRRLQEVIDLRPEDCLAWWSNEAFPLKLGYKPFTRITEMVGIGENQLFTGNYDKDLARKRLMGDFEALPARYQENQNSFIRNSVHIIRYIALTRGQHFADQVLYDLSVSPLVYQELGKQKINLTYFSDLLEALENKGFTQHELDTLASVIFLGLQETYLGKSFGESQNFHDIYSTLAKNFDYFDTNFEYKSAFVGKKYVLTTTLNLGEHALLKESPENIRRLMRYRQILLAWFPYLGGMTPLFPKTELLRFSDVVEMKYEFDLVPSTKQPSKLLVV